MEVYGKYAAQCVMGFDSSHSHRGTCLEYMHRLPMGVAYRYHVSSLHAKRGANPCASHLYTGGKMNVVELAAWIFVLGALLPLGISLCAIIVVCVGNTAEAFARWMSGMR